MKQALLNQYNAGLQMLADTINRCPDTLWADDAYNNVYWRIVYHTLYYTALYAGGSFTKFNRYQQHRLNVHILGTNDHDGLSIDPGKPYSKEEMLNYGRTVQESLAEIVSTEITNLTDIDWMPLRGLELHLYNIRHLQHHTGQLIERLRTVGVNGIKWV